MAHSPVQRCGKCDGVWYPARHGRGGNRKLHSDECARGKDCKCPPLHDTCREQVRVYSPATA